MPYLGVTPAAEFTSKDLNGEELILDADADTTITADTDDTIDIKIAGADDFKITANTLTALSGSTIATNTIAETTGASGVTIDGLLIKDSTAAFADGAVGTPSITNTGDLNTGVYFPAADTVGMVAGGTEQFRFGSNPIPGGSKNLLINGGMTVAQRASKAVDTNADRAPTDMWLVMLNASAGRFTLTQDSTTGAAVPLGHGYSLKADCTTAEGSLAASDVITIRNNIEAKNIQHLRWGEASAKDVTLSFWMSSPKSGTHCVTLNQPDSSARHYISEFTVASADTWEHFKITIPGDTGGTINNDTGAGLSINFPLVCGSTFQNTKDTWAAGEDYGTSSVQNLLDNTSNNVYITGVQLEVGSVATDFAHEDYGTTLNKCKRYYQIILAGPNVRSSPYTGDPAEMIYQVSGTAGEQMIRLQPEMRAIPTSQLSSAAHIGVEVGDIGSKTSTTCTSAAFESGYVYTGQLWTRVGWSGSTGDKGDMARAFVQDSDCLWALSAEL